MVHLIEEYEDFLTQVKHASENTISSYMRDIHQFASYLQEQSDALLDVDRDIVAGYVQYLQGKGKSASTLSRNLASIKSFYNFVISKGALNDNPVTNIHVEKAEKVAPDSERQRSGAALGTA